MGDVTVKRLNLAGLQFLQKFSQVKLWIEETVKIPLSKNPSEFLQSLGDGVLLCKFLNILYPGIIPKIVEKTQGIQAFRATDNIIAFLEGSKKLGFNANQLFQTTDLFMGSHKKNVVKVIYSLSEFQKFLKVLPPITTKITEEDVNQLKNNLQKHELDSLLQVPISRSGNDEQEKNPFFNSFFDPDMSGPSSPICQISEDFFTPLLDCFFTTPANPHQASANLTQQLIGPPSPTPSSHSHSPPKRVSPFANTSPKQFKPSPSNKCLSYQKALFWIVFGFLLHFCYLFLSNYNQTPDYSCDSY